jgi:hypothetical protein
MILMLMYWRRTRDQLERGMLAALDEGDTAEMYLGVIQSQIDGVQGRRDRIRARESLTLDPDAAIALEEALLQKMQESSSLRDHLQSVR